MPTNSKNEVILAITQFLSSDLLHEEIQRMPNDLQQIFDMVLDTEYGNCIINRRKMLRIKEIITQSALALAPFNENQIQTICQAYKEKYLN